MTYLAKRFRAIIDEHGPDAIAFYGSGQLTTEEYYIANKLAKGFIGTNNFDTNSRLCMASAVAGYKSSFGADGPPCSYADIDEANCLFLIGTNTADCHPVIFKRIKQRKLSAPDSDDYLRRSAPHRNRRLRRSAFADSSRHRHRAAQRHALRVARRESDRPGVYFAAYQRLCRAVRPSRTIRRKPRRNLRRSRMFDRRSGVDLRQGRARCRSGAWA